MRSLLLAVAASALCATAVAHDLPAPLPAPSREALAAAPQLNPTQSPWVERPSAAEFLAVFPREALTNGVGGRVDLDCLVVENYRVACRVQSERPRGRQFARAAIALSGKLRVTPTLGDGLPTLGGKIRWVVDFASTGRPVTTPNDGPHAGPH